MTLKDAPDSEIEKDSKVLQRMAPNDLKAFGFGRLKLAYTKKAIADWFWEEVVQKDLQDSHFTLMFDDTTNVQHKKELQLVIKYWSPKLQRVNFVHLRTSFLVSGRAFPAVQEMKEAIGEKELLMDRLVQLCCDGPNVTKTIKTSINQWLTEDGHADLLDLGTCHAHILHNSLKKGCEKMPDVHVLCQQVSDYFKTASNWDDFTSEVGNTLKFVTFFSVRWTTLGPSSKRIAELWFELNSFFTKLSARKEKEKKEMNKNEKKIISLLQSSAIRSEILFVSHVASQVETVLKFLERKDQIIFQADDEYHELLEKLVSLVLEPGSSQYQNVVRN